MRYLLISIAFLCISCGSYPKRNNFSVTKPIEKTITNPYFSDTAKDYVYKADIDLYNKSFSGILIIKKLADDQHRVVFTTEMGNKVFDFSFLGKDFKVNSILEDMNKKMVINILRKDFRALTKQNALPLNVFSLQEKTILETDIDGKKHYYFKTGGQLEKIIRTGNGKEKVVFIFSGISANFAKNIQILHRNIKLSITLRAI